jgi:hypothetical protein
MRFSENKCPESLMDIACNSWAGNSALFCRRFKRRLLEIDARADAQRN